MKNPSADENSNREPAIVTTQKNASDSEVVSAEDVKRKWEATIISQGTFRTIDLFH